MSSRVQAFDAQEMEEGVGQSNEIKPLSNKSQERKSFRAKYIDPSDEIIADIEQKHGHLMRRNSNEQLLSLTDTTHFSSMVTSNNCYEKFFPRGLLMAIFRSLKRRVRWYVIIIVFLGLVLFSGGQFSDRHIRGLTSAEWFRLVNIVMLVNACTSVLENVVFYALEILWYGPYDVVYYLNSLYGPLGHMLTISVLVNTRYPIQLKLPSVSLAVEDFITMVLIILVCYAWKKGIVRRHYMHLLERRLRERLENIEKSQFIISALSSVRSFGNTTCPSDATSSQADKPAEPSRANSMDSFGQSPHAGKKKKVVDFFSEVVAASKDALKDEAIGDEDAEEELQRHKSFWKRVHALQSGALTVTTCSGVVKIRKTNHAKFFGRRLHMHMQTGMTNRTRRSSEKVISGRALVNAVRSYFGDLDEETIKDYIATTLKLFCTEDKETDTVTEDKVVDALVTVYKEVRFSSASLTDLQVLHQSVLNIANVVFWVIMFLVGQIILELNTLNLIAPLLTILFGVSFAIGPMISNVFLSMSYVIFVIPYDVGNKIVIGNSRKTGVLGTVSSITLMYTTVITPVHEKLNIPNHLLFHSNVINLNDSKNAVFDISMDFCNSGPDAVSEDRIDEFIGRLEHYFLVEHPKYWKEFEWYCVGMDVPKNTVTYAFWATHKGNWNEGDRVLTGRTLFWRKLRELQNELNITFMNLKTSVDYFNREYDMATDGGNGDVKKFFSQNKSDH